MKRVVYILFLILISSDLIAQGNQIPSTLGRFTVDYSVGCDTASVEVFTDIPSDEQPLFFFDGLQSDAIQYAPGLSYLYTENGRYVIYLVVQNLFPREDSLVINILPGIEPEFEVLACSNNTVKLDISDQYYDFFSIEYGDGTQTSIRRNEFIPDHEYATPGDYLISIRGNFDNAELNSCGLRRELYTANETLIQPFINSVTVQAFDSLTQSSDIILNFNLPQNITYRLEVAQSNDQNFQFFKELDFTVTSDTIRNLNPAQFNYCFRVIGVDNCSSERTQSNVNCTIYNTVTPQNNSNLIEWSNFERAGSEYVISRNNVQNYIRVATGNQSFQDQQVTCQTDYAYSVTIEYDNGAFSYSPQTTVTAISTDIPPALPNISVSVFDEGVQVDWPQDQTIIESTVEQISLDGVRINSATTTTNQVLFNTDRMLYPQTCYEHSYVDICTNTSETRANVCSMLLQGISNPDGSITLLWNSFNGWQDGVDSYQVQKFDLNGSLIETIDVGSDTIYTDVIDGNTDQILTFIVQANPSESGVSTSRSNQLEIARKAQVHFPDAFSPNGDGLNDVFKPTYLFVNTYDLRIYNRWGELLFTSFDPEVGWPGTLPSGEAPAQTYTFHAVITDFRGLKITRSGIFLLVR